MTVRLPSAVGSCAIGAARRFSPAVLCLIGCVLLLLIPLFAWAQAGAAGGNAAAALPAVGNSGWFAAAHWILLPWATIGLLVAGCLLLYHDLLTPQNWGVTGTLGSLCIAAVFAAQVTAGGGGWLGVILLLLGLAAVLLEIHVFPGHGSALAGFGLLFAGMFLSLDGSHHTAFALSVTMVLTIVFGFAFLAYLPKSPAWQRVGIQLQRHSVLTQTAAAPVETTDRIIGHMGRSLTDLRPSGMAEIEGIKLPVVTEGEFLSAGTPLIVTHQEQGRIVVHEHISAVAPVGTRSQAA